MEKPIFDHEWTRQNTNALAIDGFRTYLFGDREVPASRFRDDDLIHLWVADMQFATAPCVVEALKRRIEHPIFGYTIHADGAFFDAFSQWAIREYGWHVDRDAFLPTTGIVPALYTLVDILCGRDGRAITFAPAYGFFKHAATHHGHDIVLSDLVPDDRYTIDFDSFDSQVRRPEVRVLILSHPHNPTGHMWTNHELLKIGQICLEHDVYIISDEIHCDLRRLGCDYTPMATLFPDTEKLITCVSPSKSFNLAGMMTGAVIINDEHVRARWGERTLPVFSPLGLAAAAAAYRDGGDWLLGLREYLDDNFATLERFLAENLPECRFRIPEATYLAWIDMTAYFQPEDNLTDFFFQHAGVVLEGGDMFVQNGDGHIRINVACPRHVLIEALTRIGDAIARRA
ncbi:MAG: aminotransferase class I/II-fold pyridoxal phosphate-dependent enzyme [Pseudomonadota bacterium]